MSLNPFVWDRPLADPADVVGMDSFAEEVALTLKARTNVAIFGARNTGKSSFLTKLTQELERSHGDGAEAHVVVRIDLKRALSLAAFISAVHEAMISHPARAVRERAREQIGLLEKEVGFDIRLVKANMRTRSHQPAPEEVLYAQLSSLARLGDRVTVMMDEFQRLHRCPGEPLAILGSALMGHRSGHVSLVFTGSIREYMEMLLSDSREPIFNQAVHLQLPPIERHELALHLEHRFRDTSSPIDEQALQHLLDLTASHPQRTQQLAWSCWPRPQGGRVVTLSDVQSAWQSLLSQPLSDVSIIEETLANGAESEANERKALYLLADHRGERLSSASLATQYGLGSHTAAQAAMPRLRRRGLVEQRDGRWQIVDPLLADWLHRNSPFSP